MRPIFRCMTTAPRKATNLSIDQSLLDEARALRINLSRAAEDGVARAVAQARAAQWQEEKAPALDSSNEWVNRNGLPLDRHRMF